MGDIQEMSFQNVVDTILKPQGIKVGGYPDELFLDMSEKDRERWQCNIWWLINILLFFYFFFYITSHFGNGNFTKF